MTNAQFWWVIFAIVGVGNLTRISIAENRPTFRPLAVVAAFAAFGLALYWQFWS